MYHHESRDLAQMPHECDPQSSTRALCLDACQTWVYHAHVVKMVRARTHTHERERTLERARARAKKSHRARDTHMNELREGAQIEYCTYARENSVPCDANLSILGVTTWL
eukprot:COSAG01_NODE_390_length_17672_cov_8.513287_9_plen_110_part_00